MKRKAILFLLVSSFHAAEAIGEIRKNQHRLDLHRHVKAKSVSDLQVDDIGISNRSSAHDLAIHNDLRAGAVKAVEPKPSFYWAVFHNWMYFLSLGFNAINVQFLVREIIDGSATASPSPKSIALSGNVEAVDKILTFAGIGFLSALSDKYGRKPLMIWSALGFMVTNLIQATTKSSVPLLYLADFVDGCSSCMLPLCQAYISDVSPPDKMAVNLGIFQGLSGKSCHPLCELD